MKRSIFILLATFLWIAAPYSVLGQEAGEAPPKVVLTEYADFQCPSCQYFHPIMENLKKEFGDDLKIEFRHFPINSHQYGALAARAAEAAGKQGKFDAMKDMLFENQTRWTYSGNAQAIFVQYARDIGLDVEQFKEDLNSTAVQRTVMEQKREGENRGVRGTPTFFVNGEMLQQNPPSFQDFKNLLESYIKETN